MKVQFLTQKFTDFAGVERSFTVAAVPEDRKSTRLNSSHP